ncbi:hypothetical protein DMUE_3712 [Dictyocoela muelleri]|nr:hypothetical protein DMUE_3712 [Dictyocoela muelleri]
MTIEFEGIDKVFEFFANNFLKDTNELTRSKNFYSLYERILLDIQTTTNSVEAWHKYLNSFVTKNSENMGKIIDILRIQDKKTNLAINNLLNGNIKNEKRRINL